MSEKSKGTWIGWQGIVAEAPQDWSLAAVSGDEKTGYFRVDSGGTLILEAKWSAAGKNVDLQARLRAYLDDLSRRSRKRKVKFESKTKAKSPGVVSFSWISDRKAHGRLWLCEKCDRVIIAQVSGGPSDDVSGAASRILPTFEDHNDDDWRTWAVYDLIADVPPGYSLEKHKMMSGYIQLSFRNKGNRLVVERWGLADVALRKNSLREWFDGRVGGDLKSYGYTTEDMDFGGESGLKVTGKRRGIGEYLKAFRELTAFRTPAMHLDGYVWICEETNKVFSIQSLHTKKENILDSVLERVECH
jgi:hypothetical protein